MIDFRDIKKNGKIFIFFETKVYICIKYVFVVE